MVLFSFLRPGIGDSFEVVHIVWSVQGADAAEAQLYAANVI